ncbi:GNAT family N-acetyltransferase [Marinobacterium sp. D7]|uniref:GNAT family N-acetyltransferase n=1 Tax=Marinobacterium ramblicola TaxID=2849041 RepID=UPI001C2DB80B|nr:GNAT family N-acetyltransferase [Marinobacterium ramblicola]MBV1790182.1 GNAT family N-acetyltransferase [Marinobacterium ramblicola]
MEIKIRPYKPLDAWRVTDIFYNSVHAIDERFYSLQEINAWAQLPVDYLGWRQRLDAHCVHVAEIDGEVVGFAAMEPDGYIDWIYTHSDFQRRGVAAALYTFLERQSLDRGLTCLTVHASHVAKPFFEQRGFVSLRENRVERNGVVLSNWVMEKALTGGGAER